MFVVIVILATSLVWFLFFGYSLGLYVQFLQERGLTEEFNQWKRTRISK